MVLLYTVSDFKDKALDCINLMMSLFKETNFDFCIVTNKEIKNCKYNLVVDKCEYDYVGFLKYTNKLPTTYSRYVYFDTDILYYGDISNLFVQDREYSIVQENIAMTNEWFLYKNSACKEYYNKIYNMQGLNAGTFSFTDTSFLDTVKSLYEPHASNNISTREQAKLEQSSYNYAMLQKLQYNYINAFDLTRQTKMFVTSTDLYIEGIDLYHFSGNFNNKMDSKFAKMKEFYNKNKHFINK